MAIIATGAEVVKTYQFYSVDDKSTLVAHYMISVIAISVSVMIISAPRYQRETWYSNSKDKKTYSPAANVLTRRQIFDQCISNLIAPLCINWLRLPLCWKRGNDQNTTRRNGQKHIIKYIKGRPLKTGVKPLDI